MRGKVAPVVKPPRDRGDHPRGCGEKAPGEAKNETEAGSSPRVRGKVAEEILSHGLRGIIPAGAGKSATTGQQSGRRRDHPRGCGEKFATVEGWHGVIGSSPRVRGKGQKPLRHRAGHGIIPAGAGKRRPRRPPRPSRRDHPRGCGEKLVGRVQQLLRQGSSPRVRGKVLGDGLAGGVAGIIPAGAGKRPYLTGGNGLGGDHPRGCGEKTNAPFRNCSSLGSSPRVRGKGHTRHVVMRVLRIIPAGAGKSRTCHASGHRQGDHPRGCGEKPPKRPPRPPRPGSSPRVRGKAGHALGRVVGGGIIPAGAGKRLEARCARVFGGDHPRGCGEKCSLSGRRDCRKGSSPRVRGKEERPRLPAPERRIIPAGAGKRRLLLTRR